MKTTTQFLLALVFAALFSGAALAQAFREPAKGSAERAAILDALRPAVETEMRGPVEFVISVLRASPNWAFVQANPQRPGGGAIDPETTGFAGDTDFMDGLTIYALLAFQSGRWNLVDHYVGPTDVAYAHWPQRFGVPPAIVGLE